MLGDADRRTDDLGGLDGASEVTRDQHVGLELAALVQAPSQLLGLPTPEIAQSGAGSVSADDALHGHVRFAMADQRDPSRIGGVAVTGGSYAGGSHRPRLVLKKRPIPPMKQS